MKAVLSIMMILFTALASAQPKITAYKIIEKAEEAVRVSGVQGIAVMWIIDEKGRERTRKLKQVTKLYDDGKTEKRLIRFIEPADIKGTGLLTFDYQNAADDIWLYMPALRKSRRIVSTEKSKNFMGSEFTYADMSPPSLSDFSYQLVGEERVQGIPCYKIDIYPNDDNIAEENGFSRRIAYFGKEDYVLRKAVYYDLYGEVEKEMLVHEVKELDKENHKFRAVHIEMINIQNGRRSIMSNEMIEFNPDIPDEYFTTRFLERE